MIVYAIDPGFRNIGVSTIKNHGNGIMDELEHRIFGARPGTTESSAMKHINRILLYDLQRIKPDAVAIEAYIMNQKEVTVRDGKVNVMRTRQVMMAYGVILETIAEYGLEPFFYTPSMVKATSTLYGLSSKDEVGKWVSYALGVSSAGEHIDDARAVGITHVAKTQGKASSPANVEELVK